MYEFSSLMVKVGANIADLQRGLASAGGSIQGFATKNAATIRRMGTAFTVVGAAIVAGFGMAVKEAAKFEKAIINAAAVTGKSGEKLKAATGQMKEMAKTLGETTVFSATQAADAMYDLASKGFDPATMSLQELQPFLNLAAATQADLTTSTETLTATIRAFGLQTTEAQRVADVFAMTIGNSAATIGKLKDSMSYVAPVANATNQSLEQTAALLGRIYDLGFPASMAGTALRRVFAELMSPTEKLNTVLEDLGMQYKDIDIKANSLTEVLRKLDDAGISSAQVMDIFGKRAGPVVTALLSVDDSGKKAYESITELEEKLLGASAGMGEAARVAEEQLKSLSYQWILLKSAVSAVAITIGEHLIPTLITVIQKVRGAILAVNEWMEAHPKLTKILVHFGAILGVVLTILGALMLALKPIITAFAMLGKGIGFAVPLVAKLGTALKGLVPVLTLLGKGVVAFVAGLSATALAIGAVVVALGGLLALWYQYEKTQVEIQKLQNSLNESSLAYLQGIDKLNMSLSNYIKNSSDWTDAERAQAQAIYDAQEALKQKIIQMQKAGELTPENIALIDEEARALAMQSVEFEKAIDFRRQMVAEGMTMNELLLSESEKLAALNEKIGYLNEKLAMGSISTVEYAEGFLKIRDSFVGILGDADMVLQKMTELDESDPDIKATFDFENLEGYEAVGKRIKKLQQEIVLSKLKGDARTIQSTKFELKNYLDAIDAKRKAQIIASNEKKELLKIEAEEEIAMLRVTVETTVGAEREAAQRKIAIKQAAVQSMIDLEDKRLRTMLSAYDEEAKLFTMNQQEIINALQRKTSAVQSSANTSANALNTESVAVRGLTGDYSALAHQIGTANRTRYTGSFSIGGGGGGYSYLQRKGLQDAAGNLDFDPSRFGPPAGYRKSSGGGFAIHKAFGPGRRAGVGSGVNVSHHKLHQTMMRWLHEYRVATGNASEADYAALYGPHWREIAAANMGRMPSLGTYGMVRQPLDRALWEGATPYGSHTPFSGSGGVMSLQKGHRAVPRTGMYELHRGEEVVPAEKARGGGGDMGITIVNVLSQDALNAAIKPDTIVNIIGEDVVTRGPVTKLLKGVMKHGRH